MASQSGIRQIRTPRAHAKALARIEVLMDKERSEAETDEYRALFDAVVDYEDLHFPMDPPDPIEAIKFRMEQANFSRRDLVPIFGSLAKTAEVLNGKRELTLKMIRALNKQLGIQADSLTPDGKELPEIPPDIDFDRFPLGEMAKRGWLSDTKDMNDRAEEIMREFVDRAGGWEALPKAPFRQDINTRLNAKTDMHALRAWCFHILCKTRLAGLEGVYRSETINPTFLRKLAQLSPFDDGPVLAKKELAEHGIAMIVAEQLPGTHLDGAALRTAENVPVVGITNRHDRLDTFWFCLLHELAHIGRHFQDGKGVVFIDDLQFQERFSPHDDEREREADDWAREALIPSVLWNDHLANTFSNTENVHSLARTAGVHPAIVAGRIRHEFGDIRLMPRSADSGTVRANLMDGLA